jgi:hypothetical protein
VFKAILSFLGGAVSVVQTLLTGKEREKDREAGRNETKVKGHEDAEAARERIDAVERPGDGDTIDSLRDNKF